MLRFAPKYHLLPILNIFPISTSLYVGHHVGGAGVVVVRAGCGGGGGGYYVSNLSAL